MDFFNGRGDVTWHISGTGERRILWYIKFWMIMGKNIQHLKPLPRRERRKSEKGNRV